MLIDLARGEVVLAPASRHAGGADGWDVAFKDAGIPPRMALPSALPTRNELRLAQPFRCRLHRALSEGAREIADAKGWTLFELPETCADGVPDA
jgi:hypothetical protein